MDRQRQVQEIAAHLADRHIRVPHIWIQGLCEFVEENEPELLDSMAQAAYDHVLETDLDTLKCGSLPPDVANAEAVARMLRGNFFLQVNSALDIGHSAYSQLDKCHDDANVTDDETDHCLREELSNRTLEFELTDGVQIVSAMEWQPMSFLSAQMDPGYKILVHGDVQCRRGILFLCARNTKLLGGHVDDLLEVNGQFNLLKRKVDAARDAWKSDPNYKRNVPPPTPLNPNLPRYHHRHRHQHQQQTRNFLNSRSSSPPGQASDGASGSPGRSRFRQRGASTSRRRTYSRGRPTARSRARRTYRQRGSVAASASPAGATGRQQTPSRRQSAARTRTARRPGAKYSTRTPRQSYYQRQTLQPSWPSNVQNTLTSSAQLEDSMDVDDELFGRLCDDPSFQ